MCGHRQKNKKTVLINCSIPEPIGNFIPITAGKVFAWNAAVETANTAVDANWYQSLIECG